MNNQGQIIQLPPPILKYVNIWARKFDTVLIVLFLLVQCKAFLSPSRILLVVNHKILSKFHPVFWFTRSIFRLMFTYILKCIASFKNYLLKVKSV